jgi:hypothetical protein
MISGAETRSQRLRETWQKFDNDLKKFGIMGGALVAIGVTYFAGPQTVLTIGGIILGAAYLINPDACEKWRQSHQTAILFGAFTYLYTGHIVGFAIGAMLGNLLSETATSVGQTVANAAEFANPVTAPKRTFNYLWSLVIPSPTSGKTVANAKDSSPSASDSSAVDNATPSATSVAVNMARESVVSFFDWLAGAPQTIRSVVRRPAAIATPEEAANDAAREEALAPRPRAVTFASDTAPKPLDKRRRANTRKKTIAKPDEAPAVEQNASPVASQSEVAPSEAAQTPNAEPTQAADDEYDWWKEFRKNPMGLM